MRTNARFRIAAFAALLCLTVAGCGGEVAGTPAGPALTPVDPATATATEVDLDGALAVSQDGRLLAFVQDDRFCVRDREPSGAKGTSAICSDNPELAELPRAAFSPNGSRVAVFGSDARKLTSAQFIVDTATGSAVQVTLPSSANASGSGSAAPSTTSTRTGSSGTSRSDVIQFMLWQSETSLLGLGASAAVYRVPVDSAAATLLADPGTAGTTGALVQAALGGSTLVLGVAGRGGTSRLIAVSLTDGTVRDPVIDLGENSGRPVLLGVSPDGTKMLLSTGDLVRYRAGETAVFDLASGARSVVAGTARTFSLAGAFSPDGTVVAVVSNDPAPEGESGLGSDNEFTLRLAPADGSTAPRSIAAADPSTAYGQLTWSTSGWITGSAFTRAGAPAWQLGG